MKLRKLSAKFPEARRVLKFQKGFFNRLNLKILNLNKSSTKLLVLFTVILYIYSEGLLSVCSVYMKRVFMFVQRFFFFLQILWGASVLQCFISTCLLILFCFVFFFIATYMILAVLLWWMQVGLINYCVLSNKYEDLGFNPGFRSSMWSLFKWNKDIV